VSQARDSKSSKRQVAHRTPTQPPAERFQMVMDEVCSRTERAASLYELPARLVQQEAEQGQSGPANYSGTDPGRAVPLTASKLSTCAAFPDEVIPKPIIRTTFMQPLFPESVRKTRFVFENWRLEVRNGVFLPIPEESHLPEAISDAAVRVHDLSNLPLGRMLLRKPATRTAILKGRHLPGLYLDGRVSRTSESVKALAIPHQSGTTSQRFQYP
jgi:hypothetical protein